MDTSTAGKRAVPERVSSTKKRILVVVGIGLLVLAVAAVAIWALWPQPKDPGKSLSAPSLELNVADVPGPVDVGVVVSYTEDPSEGAGWNVAGEGANVAAWRLGLAGVDVRLHLVSDKGSTQGARDAIAELKAKGVVGIVALTSGSHTSELIEQATQHGLPIIFPYQPHDPEMQTDGAWFFTPPLERLGSILDQAAQDSGCLTAVAAHEAGREPLGRSNITTAIQVGQEEASAIEIRRLAAEQGAGCVVAEANPASLARLVLALRGQDVDLPLIASPEALNPAFVEGLGGEASVVGEITAPGFASPVTLAMSSSASGASAGAFIQARDMMSRDPNILSLDGSRPFEEGAAHADAPSHDAVIAMVQAVGIAGSTTPTDVSQALRGLDLDTQAGLVLGPAQFTSAYVTFPDATFVVHSILVNDQLTWFPRDDEDQ